MARRRIKQYRLEELDCLLCFAMDMVGPSEPLPPIEVAEAAFEQAILEAKWREQDEEWDRLKSEPSVS